VFGGDVACSLAAYVYPVRDEARVGACLDAELGCAQVAVFVQVAFLEDADSGSCAAGQKVAAAYG
jgi:hypothetical protein